MKLVDIDWSKAPEGFPLWLEGTNEDHRKHSGWYRDSGQVFEGRHGGQWRACREGQFFTIHHKPESTEWNGEGLPPVGTVCEFRSKSEDCVMWRKAEVMYLTRDTIVLRFDETRAECAGYPDIFLFRPVRTPAQIAEEEREDSIEKMIDDIGRLKQQGYTEQQRWCAKLYDAGYRKFEITDE